MRTAGGNAAEEGLHLHLEGKNHPNCNKEWKAEEQINEGGADLAQERSIKMWG